MKLYLKNRDNRYDATAEYDIITKKFVVLKGSRVSDTISTAHTFRGTKYIEKVREETVKNGVVQRDVEFKSASTAANYITGGSTNGLRAWKNENGEILKVILDQLKE